jgi:hypothetical protein
VRFMVDNVAPEKFFLPVFSIFNANHSIRNFNPFVVTFAQFLSTYVSSSVPEVPVSSHQAAHYFIFVTLVRAVVSDLELAVTRKL